MGNKPGATDYSPDGTEEEDMKIELKRDMGLLEKERAATDILTNELSRAQKIFADECHKVKAADNSAFPNTYQELKLPYDAEGYCVSFTHDQEGEYVEFFQKYGVVVIRGLLTDEECARSESECWDFIERHATKSFPCKRDDPTTWDNWPELKHLGILGNEIVLSKQFFENRQNPLIYKVFTKLLGSDDLHVNIGRASAMRPTKEVTVPAQDAFKKGWKRDFDKETFDANPLVKFDKPEWKTLSDWLHLDLSPWTGQTTCFGWQSTDWKLNSGYYPWKTQSTLALVDCGPNDGGFHCVPGFQHHIKGWAHENLVHFKPHQHIGSVQIPDGDPMRQHICRVPVRKGSLIVWMSMTPHGTFPNDSNHGRMLQYIGYKRVDDISIQPLFQDENIFPPDWQPSELGRKLFGLDKD